MADTKKRKKTTSTAGRNAGRRKPDRRSGNKTNKYKRNASDDTEKEGLTPEVKTDIALLIVIAAAIFIFLSCFGLGGAAGKAVGSVCFGLFGVMSYIFPVIFLISVLFAVSNKGSQAAVNKIVECIAAFVFVCCLIELIFDGSSVSKPMMAFKYGRLYHTGGGLLGSLFAWTFNRIFGFTFSVILTVILILICLVLIFEKGILQAFGRVADRKLKQEKESLQEIHERRAEEKERKREENISRMSINNDLSVDEKKRKHMKTDELHQISADDGLISDEPEVKNVSLDSEADKPEISFHMAEVQSDDASDDHDTVPEEYAEDDIEKKVINVSETPYNDQSIDNDQSSNNSPVSNNDQVSSNENTGVADSSSQKYPDHVQADEKKPVGAVSEAETAVQKVPAKYVFPSVDLLKKGPKGKGLNTRAALQETADKLENTLRNFGVNVTVTDVSCGPAVTRYEIQPEMGVKVSRIVNLADDIKLNLAAADIRIEAPIPGKAAVGIEVPNKEVVMVPFRDMMESEEFKKSKSKIAFCAGRDIGGNVIVSDIAKMPHLLIAGATGSGKSVCINTIIMSILYKARPDEVKFIMIDPKVVELSVYNGIPHLLIPVVTDPKKAAGALNWAVKEMEDRYKKFADSGVRDMKGYNAKFDNPLMKMPQIVVIVDELADLMMVSSSEVEQSICRLAQLARAAGIHLVIATQRPSVNVITGLIKANMPSRIAFSVTSGVDSRTILDMNGAEKLLGKGDMLYYPQGFTKPVRVQGAFVSDDEVSAVVDFIKKANGGDAAYDQSIQEAVDSAPESEAVAINGEPGGFNDRDEYFAEAGRFVIEKEKGSIGMLQRRFKIGFNRAARIMDQLEEAGVVGPEEGTKPRKILLTPQEFEDTLNGDNL